jgi:hypothetical protein
MTGARPARGVTASCGRSAHAGPGDNLPLLSTCRRQRAAPEPAAAAPDKYADEMADIEKQARRADHTQTQSGYQPGRHVRRGRLGGSGLCIDCRAPAPRRHGVDAVGPLFINQLLFRAYGRYTAPGGVPLLLVLDEAAELKNQIDFKSLLSVARAARVSALLAVQDVTQFDDKSRSVVFGNCGTLIHLPGATYESAKYLSAQLGQHPMQTRRPRWHRRPAGGETSTRTPGRPP